MQWKLRKTNKKLALAKININLQIPALTAFYDIRPRNGMGLVL